MQTYMTKTKKTDSRRPVLSSELRDATLREAEPVSAGNINLGGGRCPELPEALHARVQAQFGFSPDSIRVRESAQVSEAAPVTPVSASSAPVQGFFGFGKKRDLSKRFNENAKLELELMRDFSEMHNLKSGQRANEVDPRQVMNIMNVVSGGKGMKGRKLKNFMKDLGGSDMEKKKPILDKFFKNMSNDVLNFDKRMMDEDYIEGNIDKVQNFLGANSAYNNMKNQKGLGYDLDSKQENIIDKSSPFSAMYSGYVHALLSSKHNLKKANDFGDVPSEMIGEYKKMAQSQFGGIKDIQKKHKKPWWKFW